MINILYSPLLRYDSSMTSGFDNNRLDRIERTNTSSRKDELFTSGLLIEKIRPENAGIYYRQNGKPAFTKYYNINSSLLPDRSFSVTHSGGLVICAWSDQDDVGVDFEPADRKIIDRITRKLCSAEETAAFEKLDKQEFLLKLFTRKEALSKLLGLGLALDFSEITDKGFISGWDRKDFTSEISVSPDLFKSNERPKKFMVRTLHFENGYLSLAYESDSSAQDDRYELNVSKY